MFFRYLLAMSLILSATFSMALAQDTQQTRDIDTSAEAPSTESAQELLSEEEQKKAQELDAAEIAKQAKQKAEQEKAEQKKQLESRKAKSPKGVFKPTEEISEDSPVSFPIDI
jgi:hypothetical protein